MGGNNATMAQFPVLHEYDGIGNHIVFSDLIPTGFCIDNIYLTGIESSKIIGGIHHFLLIFLLAFFLTGLTDKVRAADLYITPQNPVVEAGSSIGLSVSGATGDLIWTCSRGAIIGQARTVTYVAPAEAGTDVVTVLSGDTYGVVRVV